MDRTREGQHSMGVCMHACIHSRDTSVDLYMLPTPQCMIRTVCLFEGQRGQTHSKNIPFIQIKNPETRGGLPYSTAVLLLYLLMESGRAEGEAGQLGRFFFCIHTQLRARSSPPALIDVSSLSRGPKRANSRTSISVVIAPPSMPPM